MVLLYSVRPLSLEKCPKEKRLVLQRAFSSLPQTAHHLGILKAKLAKLRRELITPKSSGGPAGEGFDVAKTGDARIGFVGFPSVIIALPIESHLF